MRYLFVFLIGLLVLPVHASVKVDVFTAEVVLDENESDAEKLAKAEGLKQVIIKASGDKNAINSPVIKKVLHKSGLYLSQIGYGDQFGQQTLQMVFNPPQIQSLLNQAELPYWSNIRSNLIVWVIQEGNYGREILWEHTGDSSLNQIKFLSDLRGLPITIPVGDIEDVTSISGPDLWGGFTGPISQASQRYSSDAVLVIRVQKASNGSYIRWTLYDEKPQYIVDSKREPVVGNASGDTHEALEEVIDEVSNYYARKSSIKSSGKSENTITAQFIEVDSAISFFTLETILKGLNSVAGVDVDKIVGNEVTFNIHLLGSELDFETEVVQNSHIRKFELMEIEEPFAPLLDDSNVDLAEGSEVAELQEPETLKDNKEVALDATDSVTEQQTNDISSTTPDIVELDPLSKTQEVIPEEVKPLIFEWIQ